MKSIHQLKQMMKNTAYQAALKVLRTYNYGSDRSALFPLEAAVRAGLKDPALRRSIGQALENFLQKWLSAPAFEFVCRQLALLKWESAVPKVARFLTDPHRQYAARLLLEAIRSPAAVSAIQAAVPSTQGSLRAGLLTSLGKLRAESAIPLLEQMATEPDPQVVEAAVWALGQIGTLPAAQALLRITQQPFRGRPSILADACHTVAQSPQVRGSTLAIQLQKQKPTHKGPTGTEK